MDTARLHMASKTASYLPPHSNHSSSRRVPVESTSLPHSSWLSDATEFTPAPSQSYLAVGLSAPGTDSILSAGSASDSSLHNRTVHRARSRDYLLSTSPTSPPPSSSRTQSRHTPSPIPSPSHTLHPARSFTASGPHKTSGMSSDRDASGHLDIKRLMSKPARQTPSGSVSLPSDSERSADASSSRILPSRRPSEGAMSRPPLSRSASASREKLSLHVNTTGLRSSSAPRHGHTSSPERKPEALPGKPQRNVLRRRPSARSNPPTSSPPVHHTRAATDDFIMPSRSLSTKHQLAYLRDDVPFAAYANRTAPSPSTSAVRASTAPRSKASSSSPVSRNPAMPAGLTPAGAVALAYKQQEQRREELAETASFNEAYHPQPPAPTLQPAAPPARKPEPSTSAHKLDAFNGSRDANPSVEAEEGGEPYYTVFGSSTGRVVAVGGPEDDWQYSAYEPRTVVSATGKPASATPTRSLSRKVSTSFKRVAGTMKHERDHRELPTVPREERKQFEGLNGEQGRSSPSQSQSRVARKPIALDMSLEERISPKGSPTTKLSPAAKTTPSPQEEGRSSRASKTTKGSKEREEELSPGGKWWKLMKRISTGGLREKYQQDPAPPPVPALPQHVSSMAPSRTTMDISSRDVHGQDVSENGVLLRRFMQSRASMSGVRPTLSPSSKSPSSSRPSTSTGTVGRPSTAKSRASISTPGHRPGTSSSSPGSSEVASSGSFHHNRAPSARSSFSSYGEEIPPVPKNVGQYILPPSELSRMAKQPPALTIPPHNPSPSRRNRAPSRSHTAPLESTKPKENSSPENLAVPSLPHPPRRTTTTGVPVPSPVSPSFNVEDTINNLMPPQPAAPPPLTEFGVNEPPPRPKRSSRRVPPPTVEIPSRSQSMSATMPRSPATPRATPQVSVDVSLLRKPSVGALSYASTARQQPTSTSAHYSSSSNSNSNSPGSALTSPSSAVSQKRSPLMFREMESPRHRLTEKEKADKWEDLLERSARAGGTLRVGESHLLSDQADIDAESFVQGSDSEA